MRIWSLHPKYLDAKGLVALWREALLAQAVIAGETKGYRNHPQLERFRAQPSPSAFIAQYLRTVRAESTARGYRFDAGKIARRRTSRHIDVPHGQMDFEWRHLMNKLVIRAPDRHEELVLETSPEPHPLFRVVPGGVAGWERPKSLSGNDKGRIEMLRDIIEPVEAAWEVEET